MLSKHQCKDTHVWGTLLKRKARPHSTGGGYILQSRDTQIVHQLHSLWTAGGPGERELLLNEKPRSPSQSWLPPEGSEVYKAPFPRPSLMSCSWVLGHPLGGKQGIPEADRLCELQAGGLAGLLEDGGSGRLNQVYGLAWRLHLTTEGRRGTVSCHHTEGLGAWGGVHIKGFVGVSLVTLSTK